MTFDIFLINESKLDDSLNDNCINIPNYNVIRKDRTRHGGGVAIYINENLSYCLRDDLVPVDLEMLCIELKFQMSKPFLICTWYRPPNTDMSLLHKYEEFLTNADAEFNELIILGDLNCDYSVDLGCDTVSENLKFVNSLFNLEQMINEPTRITQSSRTLLDVVLTNYPDRITSSGVIHLGISDHSLIYCVRKINSQPKFGHKKIKYRDTKSFDTKKFVDCLKQVQWETFFSNSDPNKSWGMFYKVLVDLLNSHSPMKTKRIRLKAIPWLTNDIKKLMHSRDFYKKRAAKFSNPQDWEKYKSLRNQVTSEIRDSKAKFYKENIQNSKKDPKKAWKLVNELLSSSPRSNTIPLINKDGKELINHKEIAEVFNQYFSTVGANLAKLVGSTNTSHMKFVKQTNCKFSLQPISISQVTKLISSLDTNKSTGIDNLSAKILKVIGEAIAPHLTHIFNLCIYHGKFINEWKVAKVTPIFKGGSRSDLGNYRPISILPILSKIFEKLIFNQMYDYLYSNNLLETNQSGFRPLHSTATCLLKQVNDWLRNIDNGLINGIVQIDIKKAFDSVDHNILIEKLTAYGFCNTTIDFFKSYLSNRTQHCIVNNIITSATTITHGVPQGSVLGPLLFLLYINDLPNCLKYSDYSLYADDTQIYSASSNCSELSDRLNCDLLLLQNWLDTNKLNLHPDKTKCILIGSHQRLKGQTLDITIDDHSITPSNEIKSLGVMLDNNLKWNAHVNLILKKTRSALGALKRIKPFVPRENLIQLYNNLVTPYFDYCCEVWGDLNQGLADKLQKIQNRAARIITGATYDVRSEEVLNSLGWQPLHIRRERLLAKLMFKCFNGLAPPYLGKYPIQLAIPSAIQP